MNKNMITMLVLSFYLAFRLLNNSIYLFTHYVPNLLYNDKLSSYINNRILYDFLKFCLFDFL